MAPGGACAHGPRRWHAGPVPAELLTFGHGTLDQDGIVEALRRGGVERLVDVRRFPGSRRHPHVATEQLAAWLPEAGVTYRWEPRLGGRRRVAASTTAGPDGPSGAGPDLWWQVEAFRAYAAHARTEEFRAALDDVLAEAAHARTAVMCSETVWWRCHRRIISDVTVLVRAVPVLHLSHDGRLAPHRPAAGARLTADGLVYDRADDPER